MNAALSRTSGRSRGGWGSATGGTIVRSNQLTVRHLRAVGGLELERDSAADDGRRVDLGEPNAVGGGSKSNHGHAGERDTTEKWPASRMASTVSNVRVYREVWWRGVQIPRLAP